MKLLIAMAQKVRMCAAAALLVAGSGGVLAQEHIPARHDIAFNRYYTYAELEEHLKQIAKAYPELVTLEKIGESLEGRDLWLVTLNAPRTGPHSSKPAMWIDGNVHGNEIQSAEVVLYSLWYLTKAYGVNEKLTELLDRYSFYFVVSQNPDGREAWFQEAQTPHSSRSNRRAVDNDRDGRFDEDGPDDLDGDGHITTMWKRDAGGRWIRDRHDPRIFTRVAEDERGEWTMLGSEGIDNDGDGQTNEDGVGGDDMNRNWPSDWQPGYIQWGAGEFPFSNPETLAIGKAILARPNIIAGQSYHNAGGMLLRGPGAVYRENMYPQQDRAVYDEIGRKGEDILPYYRYLVIYKDLYTVYGGFVNWLAEGRGIYAFTNEMWTPAMMFQRDVSRPSEKQNWLWRDYLKFGEDFVEYKEFEHPQHGTVLIGGLNKWSSRNTPTFMLEEECHRNFAFTMYHADQMPVLSFERIEVERGPAADLWIITVEIRNQKLMPTRSAVARQHRIGRNDLLICVPPEAGAVVASGRLANRQTERMDAVRHEPGRVQLEAGVPGRDTVIYRFLVTSPAGGRVRLQYQAEKAQDIEAEIELREP